MEQHDGRAEVHLNEHQRAQVGMQVDYFLELVQKRYGIEMVEVVEAVKWVQSHKAAADKMKHASVLSLISVVAGALALSIWEGVKAALGSGGR